MDKWIKLKALRAAGLEERLYRYVLEIYRIVGCVKIFSEA